MKVSTDPFSVYKKKQLTLVPEIGKGRININCEKELIYEALDYFRGL